MHERTSLGARDELIVMSGFSHYENSKSIFYKWTKNVPRSLEICFKEALEIKNEHQRIYLDVTTIFQLLKFSISFTFSFNTVREISVQLTDDSLTRLTSCALKNQIKVFLPQSCNYQARILSEENSPVK